MFLLFRSRESPPAAGGMSASQEREEAAAGHSEILKPLFAAHCGSMKKNMDDVGPTAYSNTG